MSFPLSPTNNQIYTAATGEQYVWRNDKSTWRKVRGSSVFYYSNKTTIDQTTTIAATGENAVTAGPVTIANGITVTVPTGTTWSIVGE